MKAPSRAWYKYEPIASTDALIAALGISSSMLAEALTAAPMSYRRQEQRKPDRGIRVTYSVSEPLKSVQGRILHRILRKVDVPPYLLGGRPGKDYLDNVKLHCGAKILFGEDVASFYPSIRTPQVQGIFQYLLRFPPQVAGCLAGLCTYQGALPQGAPPSGDLANLVLWRREPELVEVLAQMGYRYSRFVDDVYISRLTAASADEKQWVVRQIHRLLRLEGFRVKRKKHELATSGSAMKVHKVAINAGRPTIPGAERKKMRAAVDHLERHWSYMRARDATARLTSLRGKIGRLRLLHPTDHEYLHGRLGAIEASLNRNDSGCDL
jgi:hypothetical protein